MARAVAGEEDAVGGRRAQRVREPVALVAHRVDPEARRDVLRRLLDVVARLVGADADALLAGRGDRPGVALADQGAVDPDVEVGPAAVRVHLEAARDQRVGRLDVLPRAEHPAPAERVDDQRRRDGAAIGEHGVPRPPFDLRDREARVAALRPELLAQRPVVERRPAPGQPEAGGAVRRVEGHARDLLADRGLDAHRVQPRGRRRAGGRLALPDLVAVDHEHVGARSRELARHGEPGEARAADEHVGALVRERRPRRAAQGGPPRHRRSAPTAAPGSCQGRIAVPRPSTSNSIRSTRSSTRR